MQASGRSWGSRLGLDHTARLFLVLTLALLLVKIGQRLLPPLLPVIIDDLGITSFQAGFGLTVLSASMALGQFPGGRLSDELTRKTVIVGSLVVVLAGFVLLAFTPTYAVFLVGTAVVGGSIGLYGPADRAMVSDLYREGRGLAYGIHTTAIDAGGIVAAGVAVVVAGYWTWRGAFLPTALLLAAVLPLLYLWNAEPVVLRRVSFDLGGTGARLFGDPRTLGMLSTYALFQFASKGVIGFLPTYLHVEHGFSLALAGGSFALFWAVGIPAKPLAGLASDRVARPLVTAGVVLCCLVGLAILLGASTTATALVGVVTFAVGNRAFPPPAQAYLMDLFPDESMGGDFGATRGIYMAVGSLGPTYVGYVAGAADYTLAFLGLAFVMAVSVTFLVWVVRSD